MSGMADWGGEYEAEFINWRTGARYRLPWSQITWDRRRNDISEASVQCPNLDAARHGPASETIRALEPWACELVISRDTSVVWRGPIIQWRNTGGRDITIDARDRMVVTKRRIITTAALFDATPVGEALNEIINAAFAKPGSTYTFLAAAAGWASTYTGEISATGLENLWETIEKISEFGITWSMIADRLSASTDELTEISARIGLLVDESFLSTPLATVSGAEQATVAYVGGGDSTETGWSAFGQSSAAVDSVLGLLESAEVRDDITSTVEAGAYADAMVARSRYPTITISEVAVAASAPIAVADMAPGANVNVSLDETCALGVADALGSVRFGIEAVKVDVQNKQDGMTEKVSLTLGPPSPEVG